MNSLFFFFAKLSNYLIPKFLVLKFVLFRDRFETARFFSRIGFSGMSGHLRSPFYVKGEKYISIGSDFYAGPGFRLECWDVYMGESFNPSIVIGNNVCFNYHCHVGAINRIDIGNNVLIGSNVLITDHSHGRTTMDYLDISPAKRLLYSKGAVIIENDVWIGEGVSILSGVTIGHNSVVGANSVVTHNIPPYSIVAGNPNRILTKI